MKQSKAMDKFSIVKFIKRNYKGYLFIMPVILGLLIFTLLPMLNSLYYSFWPEYSLTGPRGEIDVLYNYIKLFKDRNVWKSLRITAVYTVISLPLGMILSFLLALMVNWKIKGIGVYRLLYYLPVIIPVTISGLLWRDMLNSQWGIFNAIVKSMGKILNPLLEKINPNLVIEPLKFLDSAKSSMPTVIFMGVFGVGGGMVLWLSALKGIPQSLYESARIEGAGKFKTLIYITIPMCTPIIFYNLIMGIINSLQTFGSIMTLVGQTGGKEGSLLFYVMYIYTTFYGAGREVGYASAMSWLLFVIIGLLTVVVFKTSKWVFYGEDY